jgi:putative ABC transport system substrate-binding protein
MMRRRELITRMSGAAIAWPLAAPAQPAGKVWRIGFVGVLPSHAGLIQGMRELGYVEGKDFVVERLPSDLQQYDHLRIVAAELVRRRCDVLLSGFTPAIRALQEATRAIPIVFVGVTDPVGNGLVASLARPSGNTTGLASSYDDSSPKQLELLAMVVPGATRIGLLWNPENPASATQVKITQDAAAKASISLVLKEANNLRQIETAFASFAAESVPAVMITGDGTYFVLQEQVPRIALGHRLPTMFPQREYALAGGLLSYGQSQTELYRQAATYVHKLMRGAKPADLPVEQPTRFHLTINRKTADALGVTIPPVLYIFAEEVIE